MARMVSLVRSEAEKAEAYAPVMPAGPDVPPGLCICLTERELERFGVDDDVEVGDLLHLMIMVQATSVHKEDGTCRIEASIIAGRVEDESTESADDDDDEDEPE